MSIGLSQLFAENHNQVPGGRAEFSLVKILFSAAYHILLDHFKLKYLPLLLHKG